MSISNKYDVIILGGGIAGLTLAACLSKAQEFPISIALVEAQKPHYINERMISEQYEQRVSAINHSSRKIFQELGVWESIAKKRFSEFSHMYIFEEENSAFLNFDSKALGYQSLGYIIENSIISSALWEYLKNSDFIDCYFGESPNAILIDDTKVTLKLGDSENEHYNKPENAKATSIESQLIIGADGGQSWLRQQCGTITSVYDYQQKALVATIKTQFPHQKTAFQRFLSDSILAFLPLQDLHTCSIVWSMENKQAEAILQLDEQTFSRTLEQAFDFRLGNLELISPRQILPLKKQHAEQYIQHRIALVADAIHTIHPLAGQGLNLGLQDVKCLAETILTSFTQGYDIGQIASLRPYQRARKFDNTVMANSMDVLKVLFAHQNHVYGFAHQLGLGMLQRLPWVKNLFARKAMGCRNDVS